MSNNKINEMINGEEYLPYQFKIKHSKPTMIWVAQMVVDWQRVDLGGPISYRKSEGNWEVEIRLCGLKVLCTKYNRATGACSSKEFHPGNEKKAIKAFLKTE